MPKVLIIDDAAPIRQQVKNLLSEADFEMLEAVDGLDGAGKIQEHLDLSLVICDVNMPNQNGLDMLEALSCEIIARSLPVLMLTAEGDAAAVARAKKAGAKGWIIKPFKEHILVGAAKKLVGM